MMLAGVCKSSSSGRTTREPTIIMNAEAAAVRVTQQPMVLESCSLSLAPKYWETMTLVPTEIPMKSTSSRLKMGLALPTAARGVVSHEFSHDDAVYGVIKLLRDVSDDHRDRKKRNVFPWFPRCHIHGCK